MRVIVPPGCQNLVDIRVFLNGELLAPAGGDFLRGDGVTYDIPTSRDAHVGGVLVLWVGNRDEQNPHTIEAMVDIDEAPFVGQPMQLHLGAEEVPVAVPGPMLIPPRVQPVTPPATTARAQDLAPMPGGDAGYMLAQQAVQWLGAVAVLAVVAVIIVALAPPGR